MTTVQCLQLNFELLSLVNFLKISRFWHIYKHKYISINMNMCFYGCFDYADSIFIDLYLCQRYPFKVFYTLLTQIYLDFNENCVINIPVVFFETRQSASVDCTPGVNIIQDQRETGILWVSRNQGYWGVVHQPAFFRRVQYLHSCPYLTHVQMLFLTFQNITTHLFVHLAEQMKINGLLHSTW